MDERQMKELDYTDLANIEETLEKIFYSVLAFCIMFGLLSVIFIFYAIFMIITKRWNKWFLETYVDRNGFLWVEKAAFGSDGHGIGLGRFDFEEDVSVAGRVGDLELAQPVFHDVEGAPEPELARRVRLHPGTGDHLGHDHFHSIRG